MWWDFVNRRAAIRWLGEAMPEKDATESTNTLVRTFSGIECNDLIINKVLMLARVPKTNWIKHLMHLGFAPDVKVFPQEAK